MANVFLNFFFLLSCVSPTIMESAIFRSQMNPHFPPLCCLEGQDKVRYRICYCENKIIHLSTLTTNTLLG